MKKKKIANFLFVSLLQQMSDVHKWTAVKGFRISAYSFNMRKIDTAVKALTGKTISTNYLLVWGKDEFMVFKLIISVYFFHWSNYFFRNTLRYQFNLMYTVQILVQVFWMILIVYEISKISNHQFSISINIRVINTWLLYDLFLLVNYLLVGF